eukprot:s224_g3.t1
MDVGPMAAGTFTPRRAAKYLDVPLDVEEVELRRAYRNAARRCHPDKDGSTEEFLRLNEALEVLISSISRPSTAGTGATGRAGTAGTTGTVESERLDKHFFGTNFQSDQFDPRAWHGEASNESLEDLQCVWRCRSCPEQSSVCCRLKARKHLCLCGHKVEAHLRQSFACGHGNCRCRRFEFYVQQLGWEARCSCKHHVRDHRQLEGFPWPCSKVLPGKDKKPCPCKGFNISWVCTCGHPASEHETTWQRQTSKAVFAREWVAQGLRPECVAEAEEKRLRWQSQAAALVGSGRDLSAAKAAVKAKAQKMQISMTAEAKMMEAVEETLDGTRLPGPPKLGYRQAKASCAAKSKWAAAMGRTFGRELQRNFGIEDNADGTYIFGGGEGGPELFRLHQACVLFEELCQVSSPLRDTLRFLQREMLNCIFANYKTGADLLQLTPFFVLRTHEMIHMEECEQRRAEADVEIEASHRRLEEAKKQVQSLKQQLHKSDSCAFTTWGIKSVGYGCNTAQWLSTPRSQRAAEMSWRLAHPGDKTQLEPPPVPQEWRPTVKSIAFEGQPIFLGSRLQGRNISSPYNWPTTNATPVHERKGPEWQAGGVLYNYSRGIDTR